MEIRRIRTEESEPFLQLLCDVFGLDFARAHGIFFNEPLFDLDRKWALFDGSDIVSILTTVPLEFGWGKGIGIAGVATDPRYQGRGHAQMLLEHVLEDSDSAGESLALLFAKQTGVYKRAGFELVDEVVRAPIVGAEDDDAVDVLPLEEVQPMYGAWAEGDDSRLRRTEARWRYWKWTLRMCSPLPGGYVCMEGDLLREAITTQKLRHWPIGSRTQWLGLRAVADATGLTLHRPEHDLYLMGRNLPGQPQMFMTDQF